MSATQSTFDRATAIQVILEFVGNQPASIQNFRTWLEELEDEQLQHYYARILDGAEPV